MDVIEFMSSEQYGLTLQSIASGVKLSPSTVYRILSALRESGYVEQSENRDYYLTYKLFTTVGRSMANDRFIERMLPILNYFARITDCGMSLTTIVDEKCVNLISVGIGLKFRTQLTVPGATHPCHCTAAGKLYLSSLTEEELTAWLSKNTLLPYTEHTIVDPDILRADIHATRERGYGIIVAEYNPGSATLSIPVQVNQGHIIHAINFAAPVSLFDQINNKDFINRARAVLAGRPNI